MSESGERDTQFARRNTARISIRDRFKKNLPKVLNDANSIANKEQVDDQAIPMSPPPLPRRGKFAKVNRAHTVRRVKRLQSLKRHPSNASNVGENATENTGV
ncbi:hypothetical protein EB796_024520 [Bugula neritina]|uniref:Uncharacterized protein n=1 Tax=Bugula neritina TaxID=10212 RepID=A0A7J7ITK7_BUGNE|nr:hypothetical protein EB796_024520 [Bugula neritina]